MLGIPSIDALNASVGQAGWQNDLAAKARQARANMDWQNGTFTGASTDGMASGPGHDANWDAYFEAAKEAAPGGFTQSRMMPNTLPNSPLGQPSTFDPMDQTSALLPTSLPSINALKQRTGYVGGQMTQAGQHNNGILGNG